MKATGVGGEIRVGYCVAAELGAWALDVPHINLGGGTFSVTVSAEVAASDAYWLRGAHPFSLHLFFGRFTWEWDRAALHLTDGNQATLTVWGKPHLQKELRYVEEPVGG